jgi:predicted ATP-dependent serine protease
MPGLRDTTMEARALPRVSTGVSGFDDILGGGFPARRMYLLQGDPGAGRTPTYLGKGGDAGALPGQPG